jgi:ankyrin repeat protein
MPSESCWKKAPTRRDSEGRNALMVMSIEPRRDRTIELISEALLNAGCDLNAADSKGQTPLIYAARFGRRAAINLLLKRGANIKTKDKNGENAVVWAKKSGNTENVKLLMSLVPSEDQKTSR